MRRIFISFIEANKRTKAVSFYQYLHEIMQNIMYFHFSFQIQNANDVLIAPLEKFRKEQIGAAKVSVTFYSSLGILSIIKDDMILDVNIFEIRMTF